MILIYIDPELELEFGHINVSENIASLKETLTAAGKVDYVKVRDLKYRIYEQLYSVFLENEYKVNSSRAKDFRDYAISRGQIIVDFGCYEVIKQDWNNKQLVSHINSDYSLDELFSADKSLDETEAAILFHCYLQWVADRQLDACQTYAIECGMRVGLVRDLAVGADGGGCEVSSNLNLFCRTSAIGAPPDPLAHTGQNWGLPPTSPSEIRATGFKHFIDLLRSNMSRCGALRIDHAMSLMRLWWCPPHQTADFGAYVYYPFKELLGLLCLESHRNKCLVIGEDLGVVPDEFRAAITKAKIYTNKVFYFEREPNQKFKLPQHYDRHALAMVNNHDVPTLVSWWNGTDLEIRNELNLLEEGVDYQDICAERKRDKEFLLSLLFDSSVYPSNWHGKSVNEPADESLIEAILACASHTSSKIFMIQLEDLLMMDEAVNVPGTFKEHANWQRKLSSTVSDIFSSERVIKILKTINTHREINQ